MASDRLAAALRSKGRFSEEEIANMSEDEAWQWLRSNVSMPQQVDDEPCDGADN